MAVIKFEGDASGVLKAVSDIERALGRLNTSSALATKGFDNINSSAQKINNSLAVIRLDALVNLATRAAGVVAGLAKISDEAINLRNRMATVSESTAQTNAAFSRMVDISNRTGVAVGAVGETFQKIRLVTKDMGFTMEDAAQATETLTKALAITGTAGPAAASAMYQVTQALGRGTVVYEDLKQLQESAAPILAMIAQQFGMTSNQFLAAVQNYQVGSQDIMRAIQNMKGSVDKDFGGLQSTFSRAANVLQNNFMVALDQLEGKYGIFTAIGDGIKYIGDNLNVVGPMAAAFAGAWVGMSVVAPMLIGIATAMRTVGIVAAVTNALITGGIAAITGIAGAGLAYLAATKVFEDMDLKASGAAKSLDKVEGGVKKVTTAVKTLKLEGPIVDEKALMAATGQFTQQYQVINTMVGLGAERLAQEEAILSFAKQQNTTYEKIKNTQAAEAIRKAVGSSQVAQSANQQIQSTPQGMRQTADIKVQGVDKLLENERITLAQSNDMKFAIESEYQQRVLQLEQSTAETRMRVNGVANQAIIDGVKAQMANMAMVQQGGIQGLQGMLGAVDNVMGAMAGQNRKAFEAHKALATAQAMISTYQAIATTLATVPFPFSIPLAFAAGAFGMAQVAAIQSQSYSGRALGGPVMGNTPYIVGERGPELFTPSSSGNITRNDNMGGGDTNINFTIQANDAQGFDSLLTERRGMITQFIRDAMKEQGQRSRM